jgi:hypothetical protein
VFARLRCQPLDFLLAHRDHLSFVTGGLAQLEKAQAESVALARLLEVA